jgi:hypothetical protein
VSAAVVEVVAAVGGVGAVVVVVAEVAAAVVGLGLGRCCWVGNVRSVMKNRRRERFAYTLRRAYRCRLQEYGRGGGGERLFFLFL